MTSLKNKGLFDERFVTMEIPPDLVDNKKFESLEKLLEYLRSYSNFDLTLKSF